LRENMQWGPFFLENGCKKNHTRLDEREAGERPRAQEVRVHRKGELGLREIMDCGPFFPENGCKKSIGWRWGRIIVSAKCLSEALIHFTCQSRS
jgi:hypothetical protein